MKNIFLKLVLPFLFFGTAFGGEWGASSGEFMRDQHNPWFLKNVTEVRYCIAVDQEGISASLSKIEALTAQALKYWLDEFKGRGELLGIGTQKFTLAQPTGRCEGTEDLRIQLGYGTLDAEQLKAFKEHNEDPQDYVGIALRTTDHKDYRVNLRGKGFVFIGSDKGPKLYHRGEGLAKNLWLHDGLLFRALQHELGHVFGVTHTEDGFMAADFPEKMLKNYGTFRAVKTSQFFAPPMSYEICPIRSGSIVGLPACMKVESQDNWNSFKITQERSTVSPATELTSISADRIDVQHRFPVKVFLPKEQLVFQPEPGITSLRGPARLEFKLSARVQDSAGIRMSLLLELRPEGLSIFRFSPEDGIRRWPF